MTEETYPYKVSVCILTYNQADYIKKAVDSAIAQEVDFPYEIIIGDDFSTDGTREILLDYKQKYPDLIKLNLQEEHDEEGIAGRRNNITNIRSALGKYIAFLDGDDYWISKDKLQKQVDFMDTHPGFSICCTNALVIFEESNEQYLKSDEMSSMRESRTFEYEDVIKKNFHIFSSSTFFRRTCITPLPDSFNDVYFADFLLQLMALHDGSGKYFKELKIGRVWTKNSICKQYLSEQRMKVKVQKNDNAIISEQFKNQEAKPYSYKAEFYLTGALRYRNQKEHLKMLMSFYKAYSYDRSLILHWLNNVGINKTESTFKKIVLKFISKFMESTLKFT